jgi:dipeptidyl aminopeptidase/acylaminoacyl peptidase
MKLCSLVLLSLFYIGICTAQDGKLLSSLPYTLHDTSILKLQAAFPETKSIIESVSFSRISYLSDGLKVSGYMAVPKKEGKYPCLIFNRGGNREFGALGERAIMRFLGLVASWGYVVVGSQYRGNDGGEGKEEFGGREVNDVVNLIPFLGYVSKADTSRIGMYGWSRGGMMTYLALTKTAKIKAAIIGSGLADAFENIAKRPDMETEVYAQLVPDYARSKDAALRARSAIYWPEKINKTTPLLILHGSSDWRVSPEEALVMVQKLYEQKHPVRFIMFEGGEHSLMEHYDEVNRITRNFLDTYVRDKKPWPSMAAHGD